MIGGVAIEAYFLEDGTRVLTQGDFLEALGRHRKANVRHEGGEERFPPILQGKNIAPFISDEVLEMSQPVAFRTPSGNKASGYRASYSRLSARSISRLAMPESCPPINSTSPTRQTSLSVALPT